ncbi:4-hydroxybenzoate octaprenyltransferase [Vibrio sp. HA2012]|uniref:4-hydroxybenzoate octaprenyltransferase n=1 Tax=Vibrio sp. HA2012 TaxID=1971595 RepID=UPI000C2BD901|nr:4-hydroxybenzoate octaprenyltransferase [Vibrio sp. HA2012]PJC85001.1 4-hydroxybenzoate octaprenyltransferase [Vibrio sp. HA2012]
MSMIKARAYWQLMRMDRPIGSLLLLWPTLWALVLAAGGIPEPDILLVFMLGVLLMRSAGCVINDYADRDFDGHVKRTQSRPLPAGKVAPYEAILLFVLLSLAAFFLVLTMNSLTIRLSYIGILLAAVYPFMKRFTHLPQLFLGLAFSWAIPMAWAAQSNQLPAQVWLLFVINLLWTVAYDTQYAMVDRDDDLKIGIKSTAILFGRFDWTIIAGLQLLMLVLLVILGNWMQLDTVFYAGVFGSALLFIFQHVLIRQRERDNCFRAFLNNNYVGMLLSVAVFLGVI